MKWQCSICGVEHESVPTCFGSNPPWPLFVQESEFQQRVELSPDQCVVDKKYFFIRGHLQIPIDSYPEPLIFSVWASLSEKSFLHMCEGWNDLERYSDPPYFGWLYSRIPSYPETLELKLSVQSREPGVVPVFTLERTDHPVALDQRNGISIERWKQMAHELLHRPVN